MATAPVRVQLSRRKDWRMPPNTVKVDRGSLFGNPFAVIKGRVSGGPEGWVNERRYFAGETALHFATKTEAAAEAVQMFRAWITHPSNRKLRDTMIVGCRGKNLACWCPPWSPCHADVLLELANTIEKDVPNGH